MAGDESCDKRWPGTWRIVNLYATDVDGMAAHHVDEGIGAADLVVEVGQRGDLLQGGAEGALAAIVHVHAKVVVDHEAEPEAEFADLDGAVLDIHAIEDALDNAAFGVVEPVVIGFDGVFAARAGVAEAVEVDQFVEQADRERTGTDRGIAGAERVETVKQSAGFLGREAVVEDGAFAGINAVRGVEGEKFLDAGGPILGLFGIRRELLQPAAQAFPAEVMNNRTRRVIAAGGLSCCFAGFGVYFSKEIFKNPAKHFRIN